MRNTEQLATWPGRQFAVNMTRSLRVIGFVAFSLWSLQSHANGLWLWSWLGISEIQVAQTGAGAENVKGATQTPKPDAREMGPIVVDANRNPTLNKGQVGSEMRCKETKDRKLKIIIM